MTLLFIIKCQLLTIVKNMLVYIRKKKNISLSLAQLVGILHIICRGRGSNLRHSTSPQFNCVSSNHYTTWQKKKNIFQYMFWVFFYKYFFRGYNFFLVFEFILTSIFLFYIKIWQANAEVPFDNEEESKNEWYN